MRHLLLVLIVVLTTTCLECCKKNNQEPAPSIIGKWELRLRSGGIVGGETTFPPGNGNTLSFSNTSFEKYLNGQIASSGTYNLIKDTFVNGELMDKLILTSPNSTEQHFIKIENTQFTFLSGLPDGFDEKFAQIQ